MAQLNENDTTEFKREVTKDMVKTVVAFSNTRGGRIYIGIDDDGNVVGIEDPDEASRRTVQLISDGVRPDVSGSTLVTPADMDGKHIVEVTVAEGSSKPYYLHDKGPREGGVYIRSGTASIPAKEDLIRKMFRQRSAVSYEAMPSMEQDLTFETMSRMFSESGLELGTNQMRSMHMLDGDTYTNLAYLLSDQCTIGIKLARYSDEYRSEFLDRSEVSGSVLGQAEAAYDFISRHNPLRSRFEGIRRIDVRAFPEKAVREAVVNAVVHRDYSISGSTLVTIYNDSLSVTSLGGLNPDIGVSDIMQGISSPRNPNLASVFFRLGMIEVYGTGIPRIMGEYRDNSVPPRFDITNNVFKLTLPMLDMERSDDDGSRAIIDLAYEKGTFTRRDAESATGASRSKVVSLLSRLVSEGKLEVVGNGRSTRYRLTDRTSQ